MINVRSTKCPVREMSVGLLFVLANVCWSNVCSGKCLLVKCLFWQMYVGQMSVLANVCWPNVCSGKCMLVKCLSGKCLMVKCLFWQMSVAQNSVCHPTGHEYNIHSGTVLRIVCILYISEHFQCAGLTISIRAPLPMLYCLLCASYLCEYKVL